MSWQIPGCNGGECCKYFGRPEEEFVYGTFLCRVFGHKCLMKYRRYEGDSSFTGFTKMDFCIRCGKPEPQVQIHPDAVRKTDRSGK